MSTDKCWHQRQHAELLAARERVAALGEGIMDDFFARLRRCRELLDASDRAMAAGKYKEAIELLRKVLNEGTPQ